MKEDVNLAAGVCGHERVTIGACAPLTGTASVLKHGSFLDLALVLFGR
jgi:hypothetical protein